MTTDQQKPAGSGASVLIVDDSPAIAAPLARLLKAAGFLPVVFHRAGAALEHATANPFAAAVVDVHLPDMNGLVLSTKLRECMGPGKPIIVLSGDTSMETLNSLPHVGVTHFFSKPVNCSQLIKRLKELVTS
jgi:DNA-binding response OmpR family regulator